MPIKNILAEVCVRDHSAAVAWYEHLFGRPADRTPMSGLAEWYFPSGGVQVFHDEEHAGVSMCTLVVTSRDELLTEFQAKGITPGPQIANEYLKTVTVSDPDSNQLTFVEELQPRN